MLMDRPASLKATMQASYGFEMSDTADGKFCVCGVAAGGVSAGKLQAGDEIVGVNGVDTTTLTHSTLVAHVSAGIRCELNIVRSANKRMRVNARGAVNIRTSISLGSTVVGRCEPGDTMEVFEEKSHVEDGTEYVRVRMETIPPRLSGWTTWKYQGQDLLDLLPALVAAGDAFAGGAAARRFPRAQCERAGAAPGAVCGATPGHCHRRADLGRHGLHRGVWPLLAQVAAGFVWMAHEQRVHAEADRPVLKGHLHHLVAARWLKHAGHVSEAPGRPHPCQLECADHDRAHPRRRLTVPLRSCSAIAGLVLVLALA